MTENCWSNNKEKHNAPVSNTNAIKDPHERKNVDIGGQKEPSSSTDSKDKPRNQKEPSSRKEKKKKDEIIRKQRSSRCTICKKSGHNENECWYGEKNTYRNKKDTTPLNKKQQCNFCHKFGHLEDECWHRHGKGNHNTSRGSRGINEKEKEER